MGSPLNGEITLYDTDGTTVLQNKLDCVGVDPIIRSWILSPGTYYFAVQSQDGSIGDYRLGIGCYTAPESPNPVGNYLKVVKDPPDRVLLNWGSFCWTGTAPPSHFNIFRANSTTAFLYDPIAEVPEDSQERTFSADIPDPFEPIYYFQVQSEDPYGVGDYDPAFTRLFIVPSPEVEFDLNQQVSADPCERPNLNTTLPLDFQVVLLDRSGDPIDGADVDIYNSPSQPFFGTFCPEGPSSNYYTTVVTGTDGPGTANFSFTFHEEERSDCVLVPRYCTKDLWALSGYGSNALTTVSGTQ
jgi:hypothetical protein